MTNTTALQPVQASLEEALSYLACGDWHRFSTLDPLEDHNATALLCKLAGWGLAQLTGSPQRGCGPIGDRCDIPPSFLLGPVELEPECHRITAVLGHPRWSHSYIEVLVCAQSLVEVLPHPLPIQTSHSTIADETACEIWLVGIMRSSPNRRKMTKKQAKAAWRQMGRNISDKAFGRVWSAACRKASAPAWAEPGRPKKNPAGEIVTAK
jgi:hypothetical protein